MLDMLELYMMVQRAEHRALVSDVGDLVVTLLLGRLGSHSHLAQALKISAASVRRIFEGCGLDLQVNHS